MTDTDNLELTADQVIELQKKMEEMAKAEQAAPELANAPSN